MKVADKTRRPPRNANPLAIEAEAAAKKGDLYNAFKKMKEDINLYLSKSLSEKYEKDLDRALDSGYWRGLREIAGSEARRNPSVKRKVGQSLRRLEEEFSPVHTYSGWIQEARLLDSEIGGRDLEEILGTIYLTCSTAMMLLGIFLVSFGLTGNAIGNLKLPVSRIIGVSLFFAGLMLFLFAYHKRKKSK